MVRRLFIFLAFSLSLPCFAAPTLIGVGNMESNDKRVYPIIRTSEDGGQCWSDFILPYLPSSMDGFKGSLHHLHCHHDASCLAAGVYGTWGDEAEELSFLFVRQDEKNLNEWSAELPFGSEILTPTRMSCTGENPSNKTCAVLLEKDELFSELAITHDTGRSWVKQVADNNLNYSEFSPRGLSCTGSGKDTRCVHASRQRYQGEGFENHVFDQPKLMVNQFQQNEWQTKSIDGLLTKDGALTHVVIPPFITAVKSRRLSS